MPNPFLTTLYQNLFSAEQRLEKEREDRKAPIASVGSDYEIQALLTDEPQTSELRIKISKAVEEIVERGSRYQSLVSTERLSRAKADVEQSKAMIETYMELHYEPSNIWH